MTEGRPVLHLDAQQTAQLTAHCRAFLAYLWQHVLPSPDRNHLISVLQEVERQLVRAQEQEEGYLIPCLSEGEKRVFQQFFRVFIKQYGATPPSEQRENMCAVVTAFYMPLARIFGFFVGKA